MCQVNAIRYPMASNMKFKTIIAIKILSLVIAMPLSADSTGHYLPISSDNWRLVTDGVMGGVSSGQISRHQVDGRPCVKLSGNVTTENKGGFIQIALDIDETITQVASDYDGISLYVSGNSETYNLHLRTSDLWLPWQSYRASFGTSPAWQKINLPFNGFEAYKTGKPLRVNALSRIGVVAIGRDFTADICVSDLGFYRDSDQS